MRTRAMPAALMLLLFAPAAAFLAPEHFLQRTFTLYTGRDTACPKTVSYGKIGPKLTVSASSISAHGARCSGPGGKVLRSGEFIRASGLDLPTLVKGRSKRFFAGVESATRVCGPWAFNASAISWFVASSRKEYDRASGITINPKYLYATYSHFAHLCVYRAALKPAERAEISKRNIAHHSVHPGLDHGPFLQRQCFPASALVTTRNGRRRMDQIQVGDEVLARPGVFSRVYTFSHRDEKAVARFVYLQTGNGRALKLTAGHLVYANGVLVPAANVKRGDVVTVESGATTTITQVRSVVDKGLFAPHTLHGDVIVDGISVSSFTVAVRPSAAHALLAPLRAGTPLLMRCGRLRDLAERAVDLLRTVPVIPAVWSGLW